MPFLQYCRAGGASYDSVHVLGAHLTIRKMCNVHSNTYPLYGYCNHSSCVWKSTSNELCGVRASMCSRSLLGLTILLRPPSFELVMVGTVASSLHTYVANRVSRAVPNLSKRRKPGATPVARDFHQTRTLSQNDHSVRAFSTLAVH